MSQEIVENKSPKKNGGPYNKQEQEERRAKVYELYFVKHFPVTKITETLGVNRNTVYEDIKYICAESAKERQEESPFSMIVTHMEKLDLQKSRLIEDSEKTSNSQAKLGIEKLIFSIECEQVKIEIELDKHKPGKCDDVTENEIKEIVMHLLDIKKDEPCILKSSMIQYEILKLKKCNTNLARMYFSKMDYLGLDYCQEITSDDYTWFNIKKFAELRGYLV